MEKAIDDSDAVDRAKMHASTCMNITDMSSSTFTIDKPLSKAVCPTPENSSWFDFVQRRSLWPSSRWPQRASAHPLTLVILIRG